VRAGSALAGFGGRTSTGMIALISISTAIDRSALS